MKMTSNSRMQSLISLIALSLGLFFVSPASARSSVTGHATLAIAWLARFACQAVIRKALRQQRT